MNHLASDPFEPLLIKTADGSHTLKLAGFDEQYHSVNGAMQESQHVFIKSGLEAFVPVPNPLFVLEVGMGTGLNAFLTARYAVLNKTRIIYEAFEPRPLPKTLTTELNYPLFFEETWNHDLFERIHRAGPVKYENIQDYFFVRCFAKGILEGHLPPGKYHLVYFDAFGFDTQPELWSEDVFKLLFDAMKSGGILVTYCSKSAVRRAMQNAGFVVSKLPGPAGKREISKACKPINYL